MRRQSGSSGSPETLRTSTECSSNSLPHSSRAWGTVTSTKFASLGCTSTPGRAAKAPIRRGRSAVIAAICSSKSARPATTSSPTTWLRESTL